MNSTPRQFHRATTNQLSSSHSQLQPSLVQTSALHSSTIIPQPMSRPHFSHPAAPTLLQPSPCLDLMLCFTPDIQSSLSLYFLHSHLTIHQRQFRCTSASLHKPTTQSLSFHQPRHTIQTPSSPPPAPTNCIVNSFTTNLFLPHKSRTFFSDHLLIRQSTTA